MLDDGLPSDPLPRAGRVWHGLLPPLLHRLGTGVTGVVAAVVLAGAYVVCFLVRGLDRGQLPLLDAAKVVRRWMHSRISDGFEILGVASASPELRDGVYLLAIGLLIPWLIAALLGVGRPSDIGFRRPNRFAWRIVLVGYTLAIPFLWWIIHSPGFATGYLPHYERAGTAFLGYYLTNMFAEHFLFHGFMLGVFRVGHRWPGPAPVMEPTRSGARGCLVWLGLAQSAPIVPVSCGTGLQPVKSQVENPCHTPVTRWLGLPGGCWPAIVVSATLFYAVHLGKDPREALMSLPGGVALAYIAYRTNSWLTPFVLHLLTAVTALLMLLNVRP